MFAEAELVDVGWRKESCIGLRPMAKWEKEAAREFREVLEDKGEEDERPVEAFGPSSTLRDYYARLICFKLHGQCFVTEEGVQRALLSDYRCCI